jgi:hypothetical protein
MFLHENAPPMMFLLRLTAAVMLMLICAHLDTRSSLAQEVPKDLTDLSLNNLGVEFVTARKDLKTGFIVAGKNPTSMIRSIAEINGRTITELEADMRPGAKTTGDVGSEKGFLGPDEKLLDVLAADNAYVVDQIGLTHQDIARHLHILGAIGLWQSKQHTPGAEFLYHGMRFKVVLSYFRGYQHSPFRDGTKTNCDAVAYNLSNGKKMSYSLLVPEMIERYGFYEGKGTPYRIEPSEAIELLAFMKRATHSAAASCRVSRLDQRLRQSLSRIVCQ